MFWILYGSFQAMGSDWRCDNVMSKVGTICSKFERRTFVYARIKAGLPVSAQHASFSICARTLSVLPKNRYLGLPNMRHFLYVPKPLES